MADPTPEQQAQQVEQEQYAAIELLYSEGQWSEVLQASQALLAALPPGGRHPLRPRLQLVIGHTLLYGLSDPHGANQHYRTVLEETEEPVLRELAEQGLIRCNDQLQAENEPAEEVPAELAAEVSVEVAAEVAADLAAETMTAVEATTAPAVEPAAPKEVSPVVAAMPWLAELGLEAPATAPGDGGDLPFLSSVRTVRNAETPNWQQAAAVETAEGGANVEAKVEEEEEEKAEVEGGEKAGAIPEPLPAAQETLALLREPDAPIPVTVQVLEEAQAPAPQPAQEEPPLSPEEMAELARGLLEVVLR